MPKTNMTIPEAAHKWVDGFNAVPQRMIGALMCYDPDDWTEVTAPACGDRVYVLEMPDGCEDFSQKGTLKKFNATTGIYHVELDGGRAVDVKQDDLEVDYEDMLPMWGTMWAFGNSADDTWLSDMDGIRAMSSCGFRIYKHEEWGYFFGIDGAGYDFFAEHWIPLYKARGLQWHDWPDMRRGLRCSRCGDWVSTRDDDAHFLDGKLICPRCEWELRKIGAIYPGAEGEKEKGA